MVHNKALKEIISMSEILPIDYIRVHFLFEHGEYYFIVSIYVQSVNYDIFAKLSEAEVKISETYPDEHISFRIDRTQVYDAPCPPWAIELYRRDDCG